MQSFVWRPKYSPTLILEQFRHRRKVADSKVTLQGTFGESWDHVLASAIRAPSEVDEETLGLAVHRAIFDAACDFGSPETVIRCVERHASVELRRAKKEHKLFLEITAPPILTKTRILNGTRIQFAPQPGTRWFRRAVLARGEVANRNRTYPIADIGLNLPVIVTVAERDRYRAGRTGLRNFEVIRGAMNLLLNRGRTWRRSFGYPPKPVNEILVGPLHTVHNEDGSLANRDNFWFEPDFLKETPAANLRGEQAQFEANTQKLLEMLHRSKLRDFAEEGLRRYVNALDKRRWQESVIDLWSTLEHLTVSREQNYDVLVSRASNIFGDHDVARQIPLHVRQHRNALVHESKSVDHSLAESLMYETKQYVEELLWLLVRNHVGLVSPDEVARFLDSTPNQKAFQRQRHIVSAWASFRGW